MLMGVVLIWKREEDSTPLVFVLQREEDTWFPSGVRYRWYTYGADRFEDAELSADGFYEAIEVLARTYYDAWRSLWRLDGFSDDCIR